MMATAALLAAAAAAASSSIPEEESCTRPRVHLPLLGQITGSTVVAGDGVHVDQFLGIPYADTPQRWQPPTLPRPWGHLRANEFGNSCMGSFCTDAQGTNESEDCLFLNVVRPSTAHTPRLLPVMVWIHGGAYSAGCSNTFPIHNTVAAAVARGAPVIAVSLNYRLNFFGFLGSDELRSSPAEPTGTYGLLDQRRALEFVKEYIHLFGGDAGNITLFGESAGAGCVAAHVTMPNTYKQGLFRRAIGQSGFGSVWNAQPLANAEAVFAKTKSLLGCNDTACLRGLPADDFYDILANFSAISFEAYIPFSPTVDGVELLESPRQLLSAGRHAKVPVVLGSLRDEYGYFVLYNSTYVPADATEETFDERMTALLPEGCAPGYVAKLKEAYSTENYEYPSDLQGYSFWWWASMRAISDHEFTCPTRRSAMYLARAAPVYTYFFAHPTETETYVAASGEGAFLVPHVSDLPFSFNCTATVVENCTLFTAEGEQDLADRWSAYWAQFGAEGALPAPWVRHSGAFGDDQMLSIDVEQRTGFTVLRNHRAEQCNLWDEIDDQRPEFRCANCSRGVGRLPFVLRGAVQGGRGQ